MSHKPGAGASDELASEYVELLRDGDRAVREAFVAWLRRSPENLLAYLHAKLADGQFGNLDPQRRIGVEALVRRARAHLRQGENA